MTTSAEVAAQLRAQAQAMVDANPGIESFPVDNPQRKRLELLRSKAELQDEAARRTA